MALPNLIVIGATKCGTASLHRYLDRHPEIAMSRDKELNFFIAERNWSKGVEWYAAQFAAGTSVRGESSSRYTNSPWFAGVPARMATERAATLRKVYEFLGVDPESADPRGRSA